MVDGRLRRCVLLPLLLSALGQVDVEVAASKPSALSLLLLLLLRSVALLQHALTQL